jgi:glycosyltransferase involved in cell wall biosynthesis
MSDAPACSVVLPTHNPDSIRLQRTLGALREQTVPSATWELIVVDNASDPPLAGRIDLAWHPAARGVHEQKLGLTSARLRGFAEAAGELLLLVDDDNMLAPDYLAQLTARFAAEPALGALGGRSRPEFEQSPPAWTRAFDGLLALRDLGDISLRAAWRGNGPREYPCCAPIGAGMALRREGAAAYAAALARDPRRRSLDRRGNQLVSGGDNDLVMTILDAGSDVVYDPALTLTHLIPAQRSSRDYLGRLNRAIARSWVNVLALHGIRPWPQLARGTVPLRCCRSWWRTRAWRGPTQWVRWQGRCGQFEGQADLRASDDPPMSPPVRARTGEGQG